MTSPRTRTRRAVATGSALVAAVLVPLVVLATPARSHPTTGVPVLAETDITTPDPPTGSATEPAPTDTPSDPPATSEPPPPPSPTPHPGSTPRAGVRIAVDDVVAGPGYWTGSTGASMRYRVTNTGGAAARVTVSITLPTGLTATVPAGCRSPSTHALSCGYGSLAGGATAGRSIPVRVDPRAWRSAPLGGVASARAALVAWPGATAHGQDGFAVTFPPGPPAAGVSLDVTDVPLDATRTGTLTVRLRNTGSTRAAARVEIVAPAGSRLHAPGCATGPTAGRSRCDLGTLAAGARRVLDVRLSLDARVTGGDVSLGGLVRAHLTPPGQDTVGTQATFRVLPAGRAGVGPATSGPVGLAGADDRSGRAAPPAVMPIDLSADPVAAVPIIGGLAGLFAVLCVLVVLGVRGREPDLPPAAPDAPAATGPVRAAIDASPTDS